MNHTYKPLFRLKKIDTGIWIVDGGMIRFYGLPYTTRMTVIQVGEDLLLHSPIEYSYPLEMELSKLGNIRWLVAPSWTHYAHIHDWQYALPNTQCYGVQGVARRAQEYGNPLQIDHLLANYAMPWQDEVDTLNVRGSTKHKETVFFHRRSRSLVVTDLIENYEAQNVSFWLRTRALVTGALAPRGVMPRNMRLAFEDRAAFRASIEQMLAWKPENIIVSHGDCIIGHGVRALQNTFRWVLDESTNTQASS